DVLGCSGAIMVPLGLIPVVLGLLAATEISLYANFLAVKLYEYGDERHIRYMDLAGFIYGKAVPIIEDGEVSGAVPTTAQDDNNNSPNSNNTPPTSPENTTPPASPQLGSTTSSSPESTPESRLRWEYETLNQGVSPVIFCRQSCPFVESGIS
ncbi:hypothetical protein SOVF_034000, partial [Spinacia oleracea]